MTSVNQTVGELIQRHNALAATLGLPKLDSWTGYKAELVSRVEELRGRSERATEEPGTIRDKALELLCFVDYYEDSSKKSEPENRVGNRHRHARSVGLSYPEILSRILEANPGASTTVACLRWYASKIRTGDPAYKKGRMRLPQRRPREVVVH